MFGIGSTEFLIILIVALILIGPQKLPDIMKAVGKGIGELRRMSSDVKTTIEREIEKADELKRIEETKKELFGDDAEQIKQSLAGVAESVTAAVAEPAKEMMKTAEQGISGTVPDAAGNTELQAGTSGQAVTASAQDATPSADAAPPAGQAESSADQSAPAATQLSGAAPQGAAGPAAPDASAQASSASPQPSQEKTHA